MSDGSPKTWYAVDILVNQDAVEAVESAFNSFDALGTEVDSLGKKKGEALTVTGFFETAPGMTGLQSVVEQSLAVYGFSADAIKTVRHRLVEETDWLAEWKKYWKATEVGRFIIAPPWEAVDATDMIVIRIEPNMAFGTGTHETTQLCLKAIGEHYSPDQTFLDVGTGSGILAIAAAKLATEDTENMIVGGKGDPSVISAAKILAFDTDSDSVKIARENAVANNVAERIEFVEGPIDDMVPEFDFVCANLTLDVITPILSLLVRKSSQTLLLSGILADQRDSIEYELEKLQISDFKFEIAGEWCSILVRRNSHV